MLEPRVVLVNLHFIEGGDNFRTNGRRLDGGTTQQKCVFDAIMVQRTQHVINVRRHYGALVVKLGRRWTILQIYADVQIFYFTEPQTTWLMRMLVFIETIPSRRINGQNLDERNL